MGTPSFRMSMLYLALSLLVSGCSPRSAGPPGATSNDHLVAVTRADPTSFNRLVSVSPAETLITLLTQGTLVRINRVTGELEPRLALEWTPSDGGRRWTLKLREGVQFSDGVTFGAADVLFTLKALYDPRVGSAMASDFKIDGQPISATAPDDHTVVIAFPSVYGPGLSIFDSLPILPAHKLSAALEAGTFAAAWNVKVAPAEVVGLGPFSLAEYVPGRALRFTRNTHFWKRDAAGQPLPYLKEIELQIVPDRNAEVLRLQSGDLDVPNDFLRPEDLAVFKPLESQGHVRLADAGLDVNPTHLWFNLKPGLARDKERPWLHKEDFRRAIDYAVDRQKIVDTVFLGAAVPIYGPITPGNKEWYVPDLPKTEYDPARAKSLLASIGLTDHNNDGLLEDAAGKPARFAIVTQKGDTLKERTVQVIKEQLSHIGLTVDPVFVERNAIPTIWASGDYDAIYFFVRTDAFDPARNLSYWLSSGTYHYWNPGQTKPATTWETKIDQLMQRQASTIDHAERVRLFADAQRTLAEHLPSLYFVAAKSTVAMNARVTGATLSVLPPPALWNAEVISIGTPARR
jgi:peptide/nickel transport system substrate-binding protein